jgi:hypothetical protein
LDEMDVDSRRSVTMEEHWRSASERFEKTFVNNPFGHECDVCDRLWFLWDLKPVKSKRMLLLHKHVPGWSGLQISSCALLAENHWAAIRFQTCRDRTVSSIHQSPPNCHRQTHSVHAWFHHVCHSWRFAGFVTRETTAYHKRASRREYYGAAISQAFGRRSRFQREHKEEIDTQIYIFEWFHEEICRKGLASLLDKFAAVWTLQYYYKLGSLRRHWGNKEWRSSTVAITEAQKLHLDDDHDNENSRRAFLLVSVFNS